MKATVGCFQSCQFSETTILGPTLRRYETFQTQNWFTTYPYSVTVNIQWQNQNYLKIFKIKHCLVLTRGQNKLTAVSLCILFAFISLLVLYISKMCFTEISEKKSFRNPVLWCMKEVCKIVLSVNCFSALHIISTE